MKPTFGLVPRTGVIPTWPYLDTHGPLARSVADAALLLDAIAGPESSDGLALVTPWRRGSLAALRDDALRNARLGLVEASGERIGSVVDQVLLFCFHYNPVIGKYSAMTMNIVRLGGAVTVIGLLLLVVLLRLKERNALGRA